MSAESQINPFGVRMPEELKDYLKQVATENRRSLNTEIVYRLEESRKNEKRKEGSSTQSV